MHVKSFNLTFLLHLGVTQKALQLSFFFYPFFLPVAIFGRTAESCLYIFLL